MQIANCENETVHVRAWNLTNLTAAIFLFHFPLQWRDTEFDNSNLLGIQEEGLTLLSYCGIYLEYKDFGENYLQNNKY